MSKKRADNIALITTPPHMRRAAAEVKYKPSYFKYLVNEDGHNPNDVLEKNSNINKIFIAHDESTQGYYLFDTYTNFEDWYLVQEDKTLHEVIFGFLPQWLKFDIDAPKEYMDALNDNGSEDKGEYVLTSIMEAISDVMQTYYEVDLEDDDYVVATSIGPEKYSAHIVLKNYAVVNNREAAHLTKLLIEEHLPAFLRPVVDPNVNKSIQNFRLLLSHKVGSTRVKEPRNGSFKDFIIGHSQMIDKCHVLPPIAPAAPDFEGDVADDAVKQVLEMAAPYLDGQQFDKKKNNMLTFKRTKPTHCVLCKRTHNKDNTIFITVHETVVLLHCQRSEDKVVIGNLGGAANEADGFDDEEVADDPAAISCQISRPLMSQLETSQLQ